MSEEQCQNGQCQPAAGPCLSGCDETIDECQALCPPVPASCRTAAASTLVLSNRNDDTGRRLLWKWIRGQGTDRSDFGDPTTTTGYALCLYTGTLQTLTMAGSVTNPPAWRPTPLGYRYFDGSYKFLLQSGSDGTAKITARGLGGNLPRPPLPLEAASLPVLVQLYASDTNTCWGSEFSGDAVRRSDSRRFKAVSRP